MKPIEHAFLADILESPDDDAPRFIYADWLEENGQEERAEFIRVQCELSHHPCGDEARRELLGNECYCEQVEPGFHCSACLNLGRKEIYLRRRERELLPTNAWDWAGKAFRAACVAGTHYQDAIAFRRGFVEEVAIPLADWLRHGPALVKAAPLRVVRLSDISPRKVDGENRRYFWWANDLPWVIYKWLKSKDVPPTLSSSDWKRFPSRDAALCALSDASLEYARNVQTAKTVPP